MRTFAALSRSVSYSSSRLEADLCLTEFASAIAAFVA
jgi:hypothetical protein